jgi:hypothetical protein
MVTTWAEVYVPGAGLNIGAAAAGRLMVYVAELTVLAELPPDIATA